MEQEQGRLRQAPEERFAGAEHIYALAKVAEQLRDEASPARSGHRQITIFQQGSVSLVLFDFEAGGKLVKHSADGLVTIQALAGQVRVRTSEGDHELDAGTLLVLSPNVEHDVYAAAPSQVLVSVHLS